MWTWHNLLQTWPIQLIDNSAGVAECFLKNVFLWFLTMQEKQVSAWATEIWKEKKLNETKLKKNEDV